MATWVVSSSEPFAVLRAAMEGGEVRFDCREPGEWLSRDANGVRLHFSYLIRGSLQMLFLKF